MRQSFSRRQFLQRASVFGTGAVGLALVGCGDGDDAPIDADADAQARAAASESDATGRKQAVAPLAVPGAPSAINELGSLGWTRIEAAGETPKLRSNAILAVASDARALYLHGGRSGGEVQSDLWQLALDTMTWQRLDAADAPAARFGHVGAYDAVSDRLLISTGQLDSQFFSDVWAFSPSDAAWSQLAGNDAGPARRYGSGFAFDSTSSRLLLSHGFTFQGRFDDTWAFDVEAGWQDLSPNGQRPGERCLHACAYDAASLWILLLVWRARQREGAAGGYVAATRWPLARDRR